MCPFLLVDVDWFLQMKCQHVIGSNQFPNVPIVARKIGKEFTWQKECIFCAGVRQYIKMLWFFCQTESKHWCYFQRAQHFISPRNLSIILIHSLSVHAGLDSWSWLSWARNLLFSVRYIAMSHFQLCLSFSDLALGNEMHPVSLWMHLIWNDEYFRCYKL